ncbi:MAG: ankyrin repeat domain-containing protein [Parashewanella sp.]
MMLSEVVSFLLSQDHPPEYSACPDTITLTVNKNEYAFQKYKGVYVPVNYPKFRLFPNRQQRQQLKTINHLYSHVNRFTHFHDTAICGEAKILRKLIAAGLKVDTKSKEAQTALLYSIDMDNKKCVSLLLQHGANTDIQSPTGSAAIHLAIHKKHHDCLKLLLEKDANPNLEDARGQTPLQLAVSTHDARALKLLLANHTQLDLNATNGQGETACILAARLGYSKCLNMLIAAGADTSIQDSNGHTALDHAIREKRQRCIQYLR